MNRRKNIILLSIDALRADHLSHHGYERDTAPFLNELSEGHLTYTSAISPSSHTREAVPSILTGQHPGVFAQNGYRLTEPSVAETLSERGYATAGYHSNPYASRAYDYGPGFDEYDDDLLLGQNRLFALAQRAIDKFVLNKGEYHARAETINEKSLAWLDAQDEPFFLWNHYMDVHGPYNPPEDHLHFTDTRLSNSKAQDLYQRTIHDPDSITDEEHELLIDLYDDEIKYLDAQLERFFDELDSRDLLDGTLVIITADHGDAFNEWGYYTHPRFLHEALIHVPLLIVHPEKPSGTDDSLISLLDLVPTMLEWANVNADDLPGEVLLDADGTPRNTEREVVFASAHSDEDTDIRKFVARGRNWKVQYNCDVTDGSLLEEIVFDLDGGETERSEPPTDEAELEALRDRLDAHCQQRLSDAEFTPNAGEETTEEIEERLEALGYK